jgi:hypothetical protein
MVVVPNEPESYSSGRPWKLAGSAIALGYAIYRYLTKEDQAGPPLDNNGDIVFGLVISFLLFWGELNFPTYKITRWIRDQLVVPLRTFFAYGDRVARVLMIIIAVGGTALIVKEVFGLRLIPDTIDFIVKRGGVILLGVTVALYSAMIVSKLSYELSHLRYDNSTVGNELAFYVSIVSFCVTWALANGGNGKIDNLFTHSKTARETPFIWEEFGLRLTYCLCLISVVWCICFGLNIISRLFEHYRRDRLLDPSNTFIR